MSRRFRLSSMLAAACTLLGTLLAAAPAQAALTDLATVPLANATTAVVKPNLMLLLDTSGSMDWDFMPDYIGGAYPVAAYNNICKNSSSSLTTCNFADPAFNSAQVNSLYYNPAVTYSPPVNYDGTVRASYGSPWTSVPYDAYNVQNPYGSGSGVQATTLTDPINLVTSFPDLVYCNTTSPSSTDRTPPFTSGKCLRPIQGNAWTVPNSTFKTQSTVVHTTTQPGNPYYYTTTSYLYCNAKDSTTGFGVGTLAAGTCQVKKTATFINPQYGTWTRTDIVPTTTTYTRAASRTDCAAASTCTYAEEMTNFANWYAYYHTRLQTMKSSTGRAFQQVDDKFRVGFMTISPMSGGSVSSSYFLPISDFTAGASNQKNLWYNILYAQPTNASTPLRIALSRVGRYFAHMTNQINNGISDDPMQYYCQSNFTILSTDGLWNETTPPVQLDGTTAIGDQDSNPAIAPRPLLDSTGSSTTVVNTTSIFQQLICQGSGNAGFGTSTSGSADTACGCPGAQKKVIQREYQTIVTTTTVNSGTPSNATTYNNLFTDITTCNAGARTVIATTGANVTEALVCTGSSGSVTFTSGDTATCSCSSGKKLLVREVFTNTTVTRETDDGTTAIGISGTGVITYSNNGTSFSGSKPSCASSSTTLSAAAFTVTGGTTTTTNSTGTTTTAAMITLSPNPKTVIQAPQSTSTNLGASNTLADVAEYYYATDLRPAGSMGAAVGTSATQFDVGTGDPQNPATATQRMVTFTMGLGVDGTLTYPGANYDTPPIGDFLALTNGTLNWPQPVSNEATTVDDLWHAAVNGRGRYFSARDPASVTSSLSSALAGVRAVIGAAAAAATSNLQPVAGDNFVFIPSYTTVRWSGEVEARQIDLTTGLISDTDVWAAQTQLDGVPFASRVIKRFKSGATNNLQDFNYTNLTTAEQAWFNIPYITTGAYSLSQWTTLSPANQTAAQGANLVNFIRGDTSLETTVYRDRLHVLGDIVDAQPIYVKGTAFVNWIDTGFSTFANCINNASGGTCSGVYGGTRPRPPVVYVAANDGMLHALDGATGAEKWAYIPNAVLPNLFRLADADYANRHMFTVDGSPVVSDVYDSVNAKWRTILVAGFNSGARGYYALDITDPNTPIGLWEFNVHATASCPSTFVANTSTDDCDLGYSYGNPVMTKLTDGTWVVLLTSGYNNVSPGDGKGYLYVLNPITGVIKKKIQASSAAQAISPGSSTTPTGLSKIANFVNDTTTDNTTLRVYGGDLLGNLWRFDPTAGTAYVLALLQDASAAGQPVTTRPELGEVTSTSGTVEMVYVGTGEYLGTADLPSTQQQTIYAVKDATNGTAVVPPLNARTSATVKAQTLTNAVDPQGNAFRQVTSNPVDLAATGTNGWRIDLPNTGERVNIDIILQLGTLIIGSNVPANTVCTPGGSSFLNFVDYRTGSYVPGSTSAGTAVPGSTLVGLNVIRLPDGSTKVIGTTADFQHPILTPPFSASNTQGRRVGWHEIEQ